MRIDNELFDCLWELEEAHTALVKKFGKRELRRAQEAVEVLRSIIAVFPDRRPLLEPPPTNETD
jgi:hypothetical protein